MTRLYRWLAGRFTARAIAEHRAERIEPPITPPRNWKIAPRFIIPPPADDAVEAERMRDTLRFKARRVD